MEREENVQLQVSAAIRLRFYFNMRSLLSALAVILLTSHAFAAPEASIKARTKPASFPTFSSKTAYVPGANYTDPRVLYARTVELESGVLLSTWENYSPGKPKKFSTVIKNH
jgi:hypothetical protein